MEPVAVVETETAMETGAVEPQEEETPWYDNFSIGGFVDAYGALRSDRNSRPNFGHDASYAHEAYVEANGFALAFAGIDAAYTGEKFGATISLRMGPGVKRFYYSDVSYLGIQSLTQAYLTYKPVDQVTLDFGQFGTIFGAEVLESWQNVNYSRGALYYAMQPFWHTGLRANVAFSDAFALNAMVVNGVNNAFEDNKTPGVALQAAVTASEALSFALGYMGSLSPKSGDDTFQNFFDLVATIESGGFKLVLNADLNLFKPDGMGDTKNFWGVSVAPAYYFTDMFGVGARFEHLGNNTNFLGMKTTQDPEGDGPANESLTTLTFTFDIKPIEGSSALVLRPEFRYEMANNYYYYDKDNELTKSFWTLMLGAVVTSL